MTTWHHLQRACADVVTAADRKAACISLGDLIVRDKAIQWVIGLLLGAGVWLGLGLLLDLWIIGLAAGAIAVQVPRWVAAAITRRLRLKLARQLRTALEGMVHALRIGVSFMQALDWAAREGEEPLAGHWRTVVHTVTVGTPLATALDDLEKKVSVGEMQWFVTAVKVTQATGGSLADILEGLSHTLQERQTLREKIGALTAQGQASAYLLSALPVLMTLALAVIAPEMIQPLFTTSLGQVMCCGAMLSIATGLIIMQKMVKIEVI